MSNATIDRATKHKRIVRAAMRWARLDEMARKEQHLPTRLRKHHVTYEQISGAMEAIKSACEL